MDKFREEVKQRLADPEVNLDELRKELMQKNTQGQYNDLLSEVDGRIKVKRMRLV